jgi:hypothetical protein
MRSLAVVLAAWTAACWWAGAQEPAAEVLPQRPAAQRLTYRVEWRSIHAGQALVEARPGSTQFKLQSAGLVSKLYRIQHTYSVQYDDPYCATSSTLDAREGKRHRETRVIYDRAQNHAFFTERDLLKDTLVRTAGVDLPGCVHDTLGALAMLRRIVIEPGTTVELPVSDGRKFAAVKVHAQQREEIRLRSGRFQTIRFEAGLLNGVVYARKGRVFVWLTDDPRRLPVQVRLRLNFPIGTVTLELEKEESI